jgi:hypothetical protein
MCGGIEYIFLLDISMTNSRILYHEANSKCKITKVDSHLTFLLEGAKLLDSRNVIKFWLIPHFTPTNKGVHRLKRVANRNLCIICRKRKSNVTYKTCGNIHLCIGIVIKKMHLEKKKKYCVDSCWQHGFLFQFCGFETLAFAFLIWAIFFEFTLQNMKISNFFQFFLPSV